MHAGEKTSLPHPKWKEFDQIPVFQQIISTDYFRTATYPKLLKICELIEYLWICYLQKFQEV